MLLLFASCFFCFSYFLCYFASIASLLLSCTLALRPSALLSLPSLSPLPYSTLPRPTVGIVGNPCASLPTPSSADEQSTPTTAPITATTQTHAASIRGHARPGPPCVLSPGVSARSLILPMRSDAVIDSIDWLIGRSIDRSTD